ncbi:unnamed protein product [Paramecium primaurelia]|uniref:Peptidase M16 C-terminal domain-containing protein n=1 Tax=Paramecium primaurelia TaxID=5886 RepID=A0A8S1K518_PARPR|nr:unnamed protein product [Paramecium primaurelia]
MILKFYFSNIIQQEITTLKSGISLYTKCTNQPYGSYCIMFRGGIRTENQLQQGSLLSLKIMQDLYINKFLFESESIANFIIGPEFHNINCLFLDEDCNNAAEYICNVAFQKQKMPFSFQEISNLLNVQQQKLHGSISSILLKVCFPQLKLLNVIPENKAFETFQTTQITKTNCLIGYQGRRKHEEIVSIFEQLTHKYKEFLQRDFNPFYQLEQFKSQTIRIENQITSDFEVILLFQGPTLQDEENLQIDNIICEILGNLDEQGGEIGFKVKSRCYDQLLQFNNFLSNAGCISYGFSDSGLFGLYLKGINTHKQEIYNLAIEEIKKLRIISDNEIMRAKNIVITKFYSNLQRQHDQLLYDLENIILKGKLNKLEEFKDQINRITKKDIENRIEQLICPKQLIIIYVGKGSNLMPDEKLTIMRMQC